LPVIVLLLIVAYQSWGTLRQDLYFTRLETEVSFWGRGDYMPYDDTRASIDRDIQQLIARFPNDSRLLALRASQLAWEGYWAASATEQQQRQQAALLTQFSAQQQRPAYGQGWSKLLQYQPTDDAGEELQGLARDQLRKLKRWQ
jgi:hypothetical protein